MKLTVERYFNNLKGVCLGAGYTFFEDVLKDLVYKMRDKNGGPFIGEEYHNLTFVMNIPFYHEFSIACKMTGHDSSMYRGIQIISDSSLYVGDGGNPDGIVRLIYDVPEVKRDQHHYGLSTKATYFDEFMGLDRGHGFKVVPHIDHVKFNGPATIVFWKDGTKTVVKHDGKGRKDKRQAILYAFIRKIYGEGKPYHNILNEIEEAVK